METREIYCAGCDREVGARLTSGEEIYPHRPDLFELPFWKCDDCGGYVGCHHKTEKPTNPLGIIPTPELRRARQKIHEILDPLWQGGRFNRHHLYAKIGKRAGWKFHTSKIRNIEEARKIYRIIMDIKRETDELQP